MTRTYTQCDGNEVPGIIDQLLDTPAHEGLRTAGVTFALLFADGQDHDGS